jgi:hypothetical protein
MAPVSRTLDSRLALNSPEERLRWEPGRTTRDQSLPPSITALNAREALTSVPQFVGCATIGSFSIDTLLQGLVFQTRTPFVRIARSS